MVELAGNVLEAAPSHEFAPGFTERAEIVLNGSWQHRRTVRTPTYLTDLGVRRFTDPKQFFEAHIERFGQVLDWAPERAVLPDERELDAWISSAEDIDIAHSLDALVVFAGGYTSAEVIARRTFDTRRQALTSPWLATCMATLLANSDATASQECLLIASALTSSPDERFALDLRSAAVTLKRRRDEEAALSELSDLDEKIDGQYAHDPRELTEGDQRVMHAMVANLRALAYIRQSQPELAMEASQRALSMAQAEGLTGLTADRALRYRVQITGNTARLAWILGDRDLAKHLWNQNVINAERHDPDSIGEVLYGLSYGTYLLGRYRESLHIAERALPVIRREASPSRLLQLRKVIAAAAARSGNKRLAEKTIAALSTDPLGLDATDIGAR